MDHPKGRITPLWIIAAFVTLTEATLGYAVTKTTDGVQIALTVFVIIFAFLVAVAFFLILWQRPFVFYSPSEYGGVDPKSFIDAIHRSVSPKVAEQVELVRMVEKDPEDKNAQYNLVNSLIDPVIRQHIILMYERNVEFPYSEYSTIGHRYSLGTRHKHLANGVFRAEDFVKTLEGTKFVELGQRNGIMVRLTDEGKRFAAWLIKNGHKEDFLQTPIGGWGEPFTFGPEVDESGADKATKDKE